MTVIKALVASDLERARMKVELEKQWLDLEMHHIKQRIHAWKLRWLEMVSLRNEIEARS